MEGGVVGGGREEVWYDEVEGVWCDEVEGGGVV